MSTCPTTVKTLPCPCVTMLPQCYGVMYGAAVWWQSEVRWLSKPPSPSLSVRLAGRNQTFTAGAPAAVVLLPQLINNGHPIVARHGRTGSRIVRNSLNPATSALLPSLPRNCGFRFLVGSGNLSGKSVGPAWGKPVKAWQRDLQPAHIETELTSLKSFPR